MLCVRCGDEEVEERHQLLGFRICMVCREADAQKVIGYRRMQVMPMGNKQGYGLITGRTMSEMRANVLGRTGKGKVED